MIPDGWSQSHHGSCWHYFYYRGQNAGHILHVPGHIHPYLAAMWWLGGRDEYWADNLDEAKRWVEVTVKLNWE